MKDLIDRAQAQTEIQMNAKRMTLAFEAHGERRVVYSEDVIKVSDAVEVLRNLPSAQPDVPDTNVGDMISRAEAIDRFESWLDVEGYSEGEMNMLKAVLCELHAMPSAQPERKTGKWIGLDSDAFRYDDIMCSECGKHYTVDADRWCDIGFVAEDLKFCPNCGSYNGGGAG